MSEGRGHAVAGFALRHLSEQYLTSSQFRSHFFLQEKGLPQTGQTFVARWELFRWGTTCSTRLLDDDSAVDVPDLSRDVAGFIALANCLLLRLFTIFYD
jgi:hypothetical protein